MSGRAQPRSPSRLIQVEGEWCRTIPLTQGKETIVSLHRYESLNQYYWSAVADARTWYAKRNEYFAEKGCKRRAILMARQILGLSREDKRKVDHRNCNGLDNRDKNLRLASDRQNNMNARLRKDNKVGLKGVSWCEPMKKWTARIKVNGKEIRLGYFDDPKLAHGAYCRAAAEYHGEFARTQ